MIACDEGVRVRVFDEGARGRVFDQEGETTCNWGRVIQCKKGSSCWWPLTQV